MFLSTRSLLLDALLQWLATCQCKTRDLCSGAFQTIALRLKEPHTLIWPWRPPTLKPRQPARDGQRMQAQWQPEDGTWRHRVHLLLTLRSCDTRVAASLKTALTSAPALELRLKKAAGARRLLSPAAWPSLLLTRAPASCAARSAPPQFLCGESP